MQVNLQTPPHTATPKELITSNVTVAMEWAWQKNEMRSELVIAKT